MKKTIRLGCGTGMWGDMLEAALETAKNGAVDYLGFDFLAELTMSILQRARLKDATKGYIPDIIPFMREMLPVAYSKGIKIITNGGGANPLAAGQALSKLARELNLKGLKIGVVLGGDITDDIERLTSEGVEMINLDTGERDVSVIKDKIVAGHAYIGSDLIIEALRQGADIVLTGRCSDNALYVAPMMYEFGWDYSEPYWKKIGAAITIGHILECSGFCTGGASNKWQSVPEPWNMGYPIAEVNENGEAIITKLPGSGGVVDTWTIKEQLVYEVHDPSNYIMPDGIADLTALKLEQVGENRVKVSNMSGKPRPEKLKVQVGFDDGWIGEGMIMLPWPDALAKAQRCEQIVRERYKKVNLQTESLRFDYVGINLLHGSAAPFNDIDYNEVGLRISAKTKTFAEADKARREASLLWILGPIGASFGTPSSPRRVIGLWPTLVPRDKIKTELLMEEV